ncbi:MAG TPA: cytochrome c [Albidovulum sp.]|uniref:c-type cytochrome n=1 Tax=Albidovulum sp. TaxID=1872424 RepID=UPI002BE6EAF6|nr:cytochrome c [Albidovulum sp.]
MTAARRSILLALVSLAMVASAAAEEPASAGDMPMMAAGIVLPRMDAAAGRQLFAAKGCVVCHSVNGTGGKDAPPLDAANMQPMMNPFDFAAGMWRGSEAMVALQRDELGAPIGLTGQELADITAFVHDAGEQARFSPADIPAEVKALMMKMDDGE